jgi:mannitol/fructose-specific phosphotransferase system IIA component (Ntr-type)
MQLKDILKPEWVKAPLESDSKEAAIRELVGVLFSGPDAPAVEVEAAPMLVKAVMERERVRTTGIGHGIAIPHGKSPHLSRLVMAVGKPPRPLEYHSIDGRPVELIFLLASPQGQTGAHIQALAGISKILIADDFRASLRNAATADELYRMLIERGAKFSGA